MSYRHLYRKKDEVYEAICYQGDIEELRSFVGEKNLQIYNKGFTNVSPMLVVSTVFGPVAVRQGEYVVKHVPSGDMRVHAATTFANLYSAESSEDDDAVFNAAVASGPFTAGAYTDPDDDDERELGGEA